MTKHIEGLLDFFIYKKCHHDYRRKKPEDKYCLARKFKAASMPDIDRVIERFEYVLKEETPVVFLQDKIALIRTLPVLPEIYTEEEICDISKGHHIHEQGKVCNVNPDYMSIIDVGFNEKRKEIKKACKIYNGSQLYYLEVMLKTLDIIEKFADRYREEAKRIGNHTAARTFEHIPREKPSNFLEALQFFRLMHFCLWCSFNYHNTIGRFDQYMLGYLEHDLKTGELTKASALELLEEFFITFNKDSDLYPGMQQGDNGQSMVLGGLSMKGTDSYNVLSELCLKASLELKLIDPKINLRVSAQTPVSLYEKGSELTRQGLGFPQYSNDEIVLPALLRWGYEKEDAYNYVVAACWEFIIPGKGMEIVNIDGLSFPQVVVNSFPRLIECASFESYMQVIHEEMDKLCGSMVHKYKNIYIEPSPVMSLMMEGCIEQAKDISHGGQYNNYGIHGSGLSTAADSLAAIKKFVFEEKAVTPELLLEMLSVDFKGYDKFANILRTKAPKMGNDDDLADQIAVDLLDMFADILAGFKNDRGGIYRPGTGSAMYYIWHAQSMMATPDGRRAGEPLACNYSPGLFTKCKGPVSIIKSFSKPDLIKVANGGPLTLELHDTVFRNDESITKVAMLVKSFMDMGGHQLQLNAVNRDILLDAKKNPQKYQNLIVRVWGWSGYFVELEEIYQDHIIERMELAIDG